MTEEQKKTILIVDDDPKTLAVLNDYLIKAGFKVLAAEDGETALKQVSNFKPDLILLDLILPDMDGFNISAQLKANEETRDIPIIFLTVRTETKDKVKGFELGAVDYITKPINLEEVGARVKTHLLIRDLQKDLEKKNRHLQQEIRERERAEEALKESEAHYHRLVEFNPGPIVVHSEGKIVYVNKACLKLMGAANAQEAVGKPVLDFVHPDYHEIVIKRIRQTQKDGKAADTLEEKFIRFNGQVIDVEVTGILTTYDGKPASQLILNDITERKRAEEEMRKLTHQLQERVKELNCLYGISALTEERKTLQKILQGTAELIPPAWQYPENTCARITVEDNEFKTKNFRETPRKQSGSIVVNGQAVGALEVYYLEEKPAGFEGPFQEEERSLLNAICERLGRIIERKRAEEQIRVSLAEKEVLLREIHHRVKNNLQLINSLLSLQARRARDEESAAVLAEIKNRVNSIAVIHEKLYRSKDLANINFGEYIRTLVNQLSMSYPDLRPAVRINIKAADIFLEVSKAIPSALIINELVTNAVKYAFPEGKKGEIAVELKTSAEEKVCLSVADNGVGLPADFDMDSEETLGMQIISALIGQLHGTLSVDKSKGTKFTIQFKIKNYKDT